MVLKAQRDRMTECIAAQLQLGGYQVLEADASAAHPHVLVREQQAPARSVYVFLHAGGSRTIKEVTDRSRENNAAGVYSAHVFFKDGESSMVRLRESRYADRGRKDFRALKLYNDRDIDRMIECRDLELLVARAYGDKVTYFQPERPRLVEGIRTYVFDPVKLDYNHVDVDHPSYDHAKGSVIAKTFKLPKEVDVVNNAVGVRCAFAKNVPLRARLIPGHSRQQSLFSEKSSVAQPVQKERQLLLLDSGTNDSPIPACMG
ncbi:MAG: hypothetical protein Q7R96_04815 [Nanoarchaeota archaeon]|nr:hypothetical protein [Nanoarchaeota archaeon]